MNSNPAPANEFLDFRVHLKEVTIVARFIHPIRKLTSGAQNLINGFLSDSDEVLMANFQSILEEFRILIDQYVHLFPEFIVQTRQRTATTTYAQGGECLHRGIMNPSPVLNLLAGCNQGVEIPGPEAATDDFFRYSFNEAGELICVSRFQLQGPPELPEDMEFIFRAENVEYGVTFHHGWEEVTKVSKVIYGADGQILSYAASEYDQAEPELMFLHYEKYTYQRNQLTRADVYFGISPDLNMYDHHAFVVSGDSEVPGINRKKKYTVQEVRQES